MPRKSQQLRRRSRPPPVHTRPHPTGVRIFTASIAIPLNAQRGWYPSGKIPLHPSGSDPVLIRRDRGEVGKPVILNERNRLVSPVIVSTLRLMQGKAPSVQGRRAFPNSQWVGVLLPYVEGNVT